MFKASWGIVIDFSSDVILYSNYNHKEKCYKISDGLWCIILDKALSNEEILYIKNSLTLISKKIILKSIYKTDTLIIFNEIYYNPCDYQINGLTFAVFEWAKNIFNIQIPNYKVDFNSKKNKYEFVFLNVVP